VSTQQLAAPFLAQSPFSNNSLVLSSLTTLAFLFDCFFLHPAVSARAKQVGWHYHQAHHGA
jgi:hypothetical protein